MDTTLSLAVLSFLTFTASASARLIQCQPTVTTTVGSTLNLTVTLQLGRRATGRHTTTMRKIGETDPLVACLLEVTDSAVVPDCGTSKEVSTFVSGPGLHLAITRTTDTVSKSDEGTYNTTWEDSENRIRYCMTEVKIEEEPPVTVTPKGQTGNDSEKVLEERECKSCTESNVRTAIITTAVIAGLRIGIAIVCYRQTILAKCSELFRTITGHNNEETPVTTNDDTAGSPLNGGPANGAPPLPGAEGELAVMIPVEENDFVMVNEHGEEANGQQ